MVSERDRWFFAGRYYSATLESDVATRDGLGLELEDVGPPPGRGRVLEAFQDDTTKLLTFTAFVADPLPFALVEQFVVEARRSLTILPRDAGATNYDEAETAYLGLVREGRYADLAAAAGRVLSAADAWQAAAYAEYFEIRAANDENKGAVVQAEIEAEKAELLTGLWSDIAAAHSDQVQ